MLILDDKPVSSKLSRREVEVLAWTAQGRSSFEVARLLQLSPETIRTYIKVACRKLGAGNKTHAVVLAIQQKQLDIAVVRGN